MKDMHILLKRLCILLCTTGLLLACSKAETQEDQTPEETFLTFKAGSKKPQNSSVLYSKWVPSKFPNSSQNSAENFNLPLISTALFNPENDLILVYGKRNNVFTLPVTMPEDAESYAVELISGTKGTLVRLRVTSLLLNPLQDIFFRPLASAQFRVVIIPGEKLFGFSAKEASHLAPWTYEEIEEKFGIPQ